MHTQKEIKINVDGKIHPLIQHIYDTFTGLIPIASCEGDGEGDESIDSYLLLIVRDQNQLNTLMDFVSSWHCQYIKPDPETGNIPTYRISIPNLDEVLMKLKS